MIGQIIKKINREYLYEQNKGQSIDCSFFYAHF